MDSDDETEVLLSTLDSIIEHHYDLLEQGQDDEFNKKLLYNTLTNNIQVLEYIDCDEHDVIQELKKSFQVFNTFA